MIKAKTKGAALAAILLSLLGSSTLSAQNADPRIGKPTPTPMLQPLKQPALPYHFEAGPQAPNGQKFGNIGAVALTPEGHLIVFNRNPAIMMVEYDAAGKFVRTFNPNIAVNAHGMRIDRHGNIWVIDSFLNVIWKLNARGEPLLMVGKRGEVGEWQDGAWNGMFNQPLDIAFDADDNFYVVQGHAGTSAPTDCTYCSTYVKAKPKPTQGSDPRIMKFDKTGRFLASRSLSPGDGPYPFIHTVVVTPAGEVWVGDRQANTIRVLSRDLQPIREIKQPVLVSGLFIDAKGETWLSAGMDGMIMKLDKAGAIESWTGERGRTQDAKSNLIGEAHYLVVTPDQRTIYIADSVNNKVHKLEKN